MSLLPSMLAGLVLALASGRAAAETPPPPSGGAGAVEHSGNVRGKWLEALGLSADQKSKIQELRQKKREAAEKLRVEQGRLMAELHALMAGTESADKAREVHKQLQDVERQLSDTHFESMLAIREVLTPEQRGKLAEHMRQRAAQKPWH
jgi:Spy/CpxP family protein refolding chaperone